MSPSNPKPDHSTHGQVYDPANTHNTWIKDTKTKTARCRLCSDKVDVYSWQASCCAKRICSKCCEGDASKTDFQKQTAQDQLRKGCWCRFPSGFNPKFKGLQDKVPVKQTEQLAKDKAAKQKAIETSRRNKAAAGTGDDDAGPAAPKPTSKRARTTRQESVDSSSLGESDIIAPDAVTSSLRPRTERKKYAEASSDEQQADSGSEIVEESRSADSDSSKKRRRVVSDSEDDEYEDGDEESIVVTPSKMRNKGKGKETQARPTLSSLAAAGRQTSGKLPTNWGRPSDSKRDGKKRKLDPTQLDQDKTKATPSGKATTAQKPAPMDGGHTLIVGAGIIGLFTAYELARTCAVKGIKHNITVVEIRRNYCELASGQCSGIISRRGVPWNKEWVSILYDAQQAWLELENDKLSQFGAVLDVVETDRDTDREMIRYCSNVAKVDGQASDEGVPMPFWFRPKTIHRVDGDERVLGRIDPKRLADWLHDECVKLNVQFMFDQRPLEVNQEQDGGWYEVKVGKPNDSQQRGDETSRYSHLIFAAGPFTTFIVSELFWEGEQSGLSNTHWRYFWMDVPLKQRPGRSSESEDDDEREDTGLTVLTNDASTVGMMTMVARHGSNSIEVSAAAKEKSKSDLDYANAVSPPSENRDLLKNLARQYLDAKHLADDLDDLPEDAAFISVAKGKHPYIDLLRLPIDDKGNMGERSNVWLSYGFGRFGTTLAPGAARQLVERMFQGQ